MISGQVKKIEAWLLATGTPEYKLGKEATGNVHAIERIRNKTARLATLEAVIAYIAAHPAPKKPKK